MQTVCRGKLSNSGGCNGDGGPLSGIYAQLQPSCHHTPEDRGALAPAMFVLLLLSQCPNSLPGIQYSSSPDAWILLWLRSLHLEWVMKKGLCCDCEELPRVCPRVVLQLTITIIQAHLQFIKVDGPSAIFGDADARALTKRQCCISNNLFSAFLPVLLFCYSDDEDRLHERIPSVSGVLISSSLPLRPVAALPQD
jgi:hypothetical protein